MRLQDSPLSDVEHGDCMLSGLANIVLLPLDLLGFRSSDPSAKIELRSELS